VDGDLSPTKRLGRVPISDLVESKQNRLTLDSGGLDGMRDTVHEKGVTPLEARPGEIRDDAALQLTTDPVWCQDLRHDKIIGGLLARIATTVGGASDSVAP
jgi:hypothetical protein